MAAIDFSRLAAPDGNGQVLVVPTPKECVEAVRNNSERLNSHPHVIAGRSLGEWRRRLRRSIWGRNDFLVIGTGHQPGFIHPGVWAKSVVASRLAKALGATAAHLVVDSDSPKETGLKIPIDGEESFRLESVPVLSASAHAYEQISPLDDRRMDELQRALCGVLGDRFDRTQLELYVGAMRECWGPRNVVDQLVAGVRAIDHLYDVELTDLRMSRSWWTPLLSHVLIHAGEFFQVYNRALENYRRMNRVRGRGRPFPDLARRDDMLELPAWVFQGESPRRRLYARVTSNGTSLWADHEFIREVSERTLLEWADDESSPASLYGWSFRPRAVLLTMWARLMLCDFFIHGIGGNVTSWGKLHL
ncbi:MAG: hypothetical protein AABZ47_01150, partial [Planctomycetota bacterium]